MYWIFDAQVIVYMLVSGGREPFWDGSDIRAIKNTLKKEVAIQPGSNFQGHALYLR